MIRLGIDGFWILTTDHGEYMFHDDQVQSAMDSDVGFTGTESEHREYIINELYNLELENEEQD